MAENTAVNPTQALNGAAQLTRVGDSMLSRWHGLRARIDALNGDQPWGDDEPGKQFNKNYLEGSHLPATNVLDSGESMVVALSKVGEQVKEGVEGTADLDDLIATWFPKK
ncbi:hypothetical protein Drose_12175 [Dactylosporangium roseum]|uniref:Uncharacterized protein n=1 Tax=Dactylosporangium roseum TaxID=47989 RepID=A0ABY5ZA37_9ACTN|nr:hypothetical protein [Dactylosporangium roseum]UWZ38906.1 hypothetical protein Drose_12175 [Dactylosporangium roseum]